MPEESTVEGLFALEYEKMKFLYGPQITRTGRFCGHDGLMAMYAALWIDLEVSKKMARKAPCLS